MTTLCTFPGRAGDLLWALPTVRAIAESAGDPVDLQICGEFATMVPLLVRQPYLRNVYADPDWDMSQRIPSTIKAGPRAVVFHLGYDGWPSRPLPQQVYATGLDQGALRPGTDLALARPWITTTPVTGSRPSLPVIIGFTECWFELKVGLLTLLGSHDWPTHFDAYVVPAPGSRWTMECHYEGVSWEDAATAIGASTLFLGDCSALHVLAVAVGTPAILVEPMEARWDPIFYPLGMDGPEVTVVKGHDGKPTFDARHVGEAVERALADRRC